MGTLAWQWSFSAPADPRWRMLPAAAPFDFGGCPPVGVRLFLMFCKTNATNRRNHHEMPKRRLDSCSSHRLDADSIGQNRFWFESDIDSLAIINGQRRKQKHKISPKKTMLLPFRGQTHVPCIILMRIAAVETYFG